MADIRIVLKVEVQDVKVPFYEIYHLPKGRLIGLQYGGNIPGLRGEELYGEEFDIGYFYEAGGCAGFMPIAAEEGPVRKIQRNFRICYQDVVITVEKVSGPGYQTPGIRNLM